MLTEDAVVDAVCRSLEQHGYRIASRALATEHGHDIVAEKAGQPNLFVEAKGAGSSKSGTARYGSEFNRGQVFDHVGKAVLKALRVVSSGDGRAGIALPNNDNHRREVDQIRDALHLVGIAIFLVSEGGAVESDSPWALR